MGTKRRTVLRQFLSLPIVTSISKFGGFGSEFIPPDPETQQRQEVLLAVSIVRLINTAEAWHFESFGHYTDIETLRKSRAMSQLFDSERAEKHGIGRSLQSKLRFDTTEIVPGWRLKFTLGENQSSYAASLIDVSGKKTGSFSSDDSAIVSASDPLSIMEVKQPRTPGRTLMSSVAAMILGPLAMPQQICVCPPGPGCGCFWGCGDEGCCADQKCRLLYHSGCLNCGCQNCIWCCP